MFPCGSALRLGTLAAAGPPPSGLCPCPASRRRPWAQRAFDLRRAAAPSWGTVALFTGRPGPFRVLFRPPLRDRPGPDTGLPGRLSGTVRLFREPPGPFPGSAPGRLPGTAGTVSLRALWAGVSSGGGGAFSRRLPWRRFFSWRSCSSCRSRARWAFTSSCAAASSYVRGIVLRPAAGQRRRQGRCPSRPPRRSSSGPEPCPARPW